MQIISLVKCSSNNVIPERLFSGRASLVYFKYSYFPAFILRLILRLFSYHVYMLSVSFVYETMHT